MGFINGVFINGGDAAASCLFGWQLSGGFVEQLNHLRDESVTKRLAGSKVLEWLAAEGHVKSQRIDGCFFDRPRGGAVGICVGTRVSAKGNAYETLCYGEQIQRMFVEKYLSEGQRNHTNFPVLPSNPRYTAIAVSSDILLQRVS